MNNEKRTKPNTKLEDSTGDFIALIKQCQDGTILVSRHRHDYVTHTDSKGNFYMLDGGGSGYYRTSGEGLVQEITSNSDHSLIRDYFKWTRNFDKDMNLLPSPERILLKDLDQGHLEALVSYTSGRNYPDYIKKLFVDEVEYRSNIPLDKKLKEN